jgi:flagellar biosynthesis protein FlhF
MPSLLAMRPAAPHTSNMQIQSFQAATLTECLLLARRTFGPDAEIIGQRKYKKGAWFGIWGGKDWMEVTCRLTEEDTHSSKPNPYASKGARQGTGELLAPQSTQMQTMEARLAELTASVQGLVDTARKKPFQAAPVVAPVETIEEKKSSRGGRGRAAITAPSEPYAVLMHQLLDAEIAPPLARQWLAELPQGLTDADARTEMRTRLAQRLKIDARPPTLPGGQMRLLAFIGTTGVGKTTTIAKLAARHALVERRKVGIVTLDTYRVAAAQQLQTYGEVMNVPVRVAHNKAELVRHLTDYAMEGMELVLLDTTGRSPNDMIPLGETAHLFDGMGAVEKFLTLPATLSARDMDHIVARFRHALAPDALILTKLDEATDNACFGKLLTVQAKHGLPLAYVTTGQKVPDDIAVPDAHAIAARIISTALL